jgi:hypothetical protein
MELVLLAIYRRCFPTCEFRIVGDDALVVGPKDKLEIGYGLLLHTFNSMGIWINKDKTIFSNSILEGLSKVFFKGKDVSPLSGYLQPRELKENPFFSKPDSIYDSLARSVIGYYRKISIFKEVNINQRLSNFWLKLRNIPLPPNADPDAVRLLNQSMRKEGDLLVFSGHPNFDDLIEPIRIYDVPSSEGSSFRVKKLSIVQFKDTIHQYKRFGKELKRIRKTLLDNDDLIFLRDMRIFGIHRSLYGFVLSQDLPKSVYSYFVNKFKKHFYAIFLLGRCEQGAIIFERINYGNITQSERH